MAGDSLQAKLGKLEREVPRLRHKTADLLREQAIARRNLGQQWLTAPLPPTFPVRLADLIPPPTAAVGLTPETKEPYPKTRSPPIQTAQP